MVLLCSGRTRLQEGDDRWARAVSGRELRRRKKQEREGAAGWAAAALKWAGGLAPVAYAGAHERRIEKVTAVQAHMNSNICEDILYRKYIAKTKTPE